MKFVLKKKITISKDCPLEFALIEEEVGPNSYGFLFKLCPLLQLENLLFRVVLSLLHCFGFILNDRGRILHVRLLGRSEGLRMEKMRLVGMMNSTNLVVPSSASNGEGKE